MGLLASGHHLLVRIGLFLQPVLLLLFRLYWGYNFHRAGCDKFADIGKTGVFLESLSIPFPEFNAYLVATVECVGGLLLMIGLFSRFISIPLAITMIVALLTVHFPGTSQIFTNSNKFVIETPVTYLMVTLVIFCFGPGVFSVDYLLERFVLKKKK